MIQIKKCQNISDVGFEPPLEAYILFDDDKIMMTCIFETEKKCVRIYDIHTHGEPQRLYYDAIIRTVAAYALSKGIEIIKCSNKEVFDILSGFNFAQDKHDMTAKCALLLVHQC